MYKYLEMFCFAINPAILLCEIYQNDIWIVIFKNIYFLLFTVNNSVPVPINNLHWWIRKGPLVFYCVVAPIFPASMPLQFQWPLFTSPLRPQIHSLLEFSILLHTLVLLHPLSPWSGMTFLISFLSTFP